MKNKLFNESFSYKHVAKKEIKESLDCPKCKVCEEKAKDIKDELDLMDVNGGYEKEPAKYAELLRKYAEANGDMPNYNKHIEQLKKLHEIEPGDLTAVELCQLKQAGALEESCLKESVSMEKKVADAIDLLQGIDPDIFYPALMIYEVLGIMNPSEALIASVKDFIDDVDTVYDENIRQAIRDYAEEFEGKLEAEEVPAKEEPVEEHLGEFKKGDKLVKKIK